MIYSFAVMDLPGQSTRIADTEPEFYRKKIEAGVSMERSFYMGLDTNRCCYACEFRPSQFEETNYHLMTNNKIALPGLGLLGASRQVRLEALPVFYSQRGWAFCSEDAVIPFLNDRSKVARDSIKHFGICLSFWEDGWQRDREDCWIVVFRYIARHLKLKSLILNIKDYTGELGIQLKVPSEDYPPWAHALAEIRSLNSIELKVKSLANPGLPPGISIWDGMSEFSDWVGSKVYRDD